jgi:hypothetical protein
MEIMAGSERTRRISIFITLLMVSLLVVSCSGEKEEGEQETAQPVTEVGTKEETIAYVDEEVSYGLFFDEEGTKRTIKLKRGQEQFDGYVFLMCPEYREIASTQFRLDMPEGVVIENDKYRQDRVMSMGNFQRGISERFVPCIPGPKILIHTITFRVTAPLDNAVFTILPSLDNEFLAVAECKEGYPLIRASAFKAVVNPSD